MNISEIISSGLLESYVLGTASPEENALINELCKKHPELVKEIESIEEGLINFSGQGGTPVNPDLKDKIKAQLAFEEKQEQPAESKIIPLQQAGESRLKLYRFGLAASILLFITSFAYNVMLHQALGRANGELAEMSATKSFMAGELEIKQASIKTIQEQFQIVANPHIKTVALKGMNLLADNSAAVHWDTESNAVYFNASALPQSPAQKQYQLWAIVDGKPVDAGVIDMRNPEAVFQKMKPIKGAQAFAVTIEKAGGSAAPTMETMCLLGNV